MVSIGVIGLGEVGLKMAGLFSSSGHSVVGVDVSEVRRDVAMSGLREAGYDFDIQGLVVTDMPVRCDAQLICVDSPIDETTYKTQLVNLTTAVSSVGRVLAAGDLVVVRSTVPVGTTTTIVDPLLASVSGLAAGEYGLAFAPERTSTGGSLAESQRIRHLIGGRDERSVAGAVSLFESAGLKCVEMESVEAAELGKLASNVARDVYQALANQLSAIAAHHRIDAVRLIDEVNLDYPRDRIKRPSPGVGGSCLTKDPYILAESLAGPPCATLFGVARAVNDAAQEPTFASFRRYAEKLRPARPLHVLVCGAAFKGDPPTLDTRQSVGLKAAARLRDDGHEVSVFDPVVPNPALVQLGHQPISAPFTKTWDAVFLYSNHRMFSETLVVQGVLDSARPNAFVYDPHGLLSTVIAERVAPMLYRGISTERMIGHGKGVGGA